MLDLLIVLSIVYLALCGFAANWYKKRTKEILDKSAPGEEIRHQEEVAIIMIATLGFFLMPATALYARITDFKKYRKMISGIIKMRR